MAGRMNTGECTYAALCRHRIFKRLWVCRAVGLDAREARDWIKSADAVILKGYSGKVGSLFTTGSLLRKIVSRIIELAIDIDD